MKAYRKQMLVHQRKYRAKQKAKADKKAKAQLKACPASNDIKKLAKWSRDVLVIQPGHPNAGQPLEIPKFALKLLGKAMGKLESLLSVARKNSKSAVIAAYLLGRVAPNSPFQTL